MRCPQCGGDGQADPEHSRVLWCLSCWHCWVLPREEQCTGRRPVLSPALRLLADRHGLYR